MTNTVSSNSRLDSLFIYLYSFFLVCGAVLYLIPATRDLAIGTTEIFVIVLSLGLIWRTIGWRPLYLIPVFIGTFLLEVLGSNYGWVFGHYDYTGLWKLQLFGTPLAIGLLWVLVSICSRGVACLILPLEGGGLKARGIILAALLATFYDIILEQVAIKHGYWNWHNNQIPLTNYLSWFVISIITIGYLTKFPLRNGAKKLGQLVFFSTVIYFVLLIVVS